MEAGVSDHVWSIEEIVGLLDWAGGAARAGGFPKDPHYDVVSPFASWKARENVSF